MFLYVQHFMHHYGYGGVFIILLLEMVGIPFPAETTLTFSGIAWINGTFSLLPLIFFATLGNVVGSTIAYSIGRFLGRNVILRFGGIVGITEEKLGRAEVKFQQYQMRALLICKFIAGVRILIPYLAGLNRMPFLLFTVCNTFIALVWTTLFIVFGRYLGTFWHHYHHFLRGHLFVIILLGVISLVFYKVIKKKGFKILGSTRLREEK
jgi:membrane protein DedA with SNARE-associated domain